MADGQCIFCRIVKGEIPSAKVREDERTFAFLDIQPLRRGHALVVPKAHAAKLQELAAEDADALWRAVHAVAAKAEAALGTTATTVAVNNGRAAGQEVPHVHVHVVPRAEGDGAGPVHAAFPSRPTVLREELQDLAARMRGT